MGATTKRKTVTPAAARTPAATAPPEVTVQARSHAEQYAAGKALRATCARETHAVWKRPHDRRGAVDTVLAAETGRLPDLLPLRHGRMVRSAFTFYRGSALAMAADLATTPVTGLRVPIRAAIRIERNSR